MGTDLDAINGLQFEHVAIGHYIHSLQESVNDLATLFLQRMRSWDAQQASSIAQRQENLRGAIGALREGLMSHWSREDEFFPRSFGPLLSDALLGEHKEIMQYIDQARSTLDMVKLQDLSYEELMARSYTLRQGAELAIRLIEIHKGKEEVVLELLKKALIARSK